MESNYHILVKKVYAAAIIEDLQKMDAMELLHDTALQVPQWQMDEIRSRRAYFKLNPEELIDWEGAQKLIKV